MTPRLPGCGSKGGPVPHKEPGRSTFRFLDELAEGCYREERLCR